MTRRYVGCVGPVCWRSRSFPRSIRRISHMSRHVLVCLAVVCAVAAPAFAQFETANVVGTVRDSSGGVVADAKVTLTNTQTGVSVERTTDSNGNFEFITVRLGSFLITAEKAGFSVALAE